MANGFFKIFKGLNAQPVTGSTVTTKGDVAYNDSSAQVEVYTTAAESITTNSNTQTLTNKSIDGNTNTVTNIPNSATTGTAVNTASTLVERDGSGNFAAGTITATLTGNATNVSGTVAIANGGTGQTSKTAAFDALSPLTTKGDIEVHNGTNVVRLGAGTNNFVLTADSTQTTGLKWAVAGAGGFTAPTVQSFLSTGTITGYLFEVTSANATVGDTYTNNGNTYTILSTIVGGTQLFTSQALAPTASGTLTLAAGSGDATITFSANTALATYMTPTSPSPLYIKITMVGGGGGGDGSGQNATVPNTSTAGGDSRFDTSVAGGGDRGVGLNTSPGGVGGTVSVSGNTVILAFAGGHGGAGDTEDGGQDFFLRGGNGGNNPLGGGAGIGEVLTSGYAGIPNTGGGGSGAGTKSTNTGGTNGSVAGGGGGAGGYIQAIIANPSPSYTYYVGTGGSAGSAGTTGFSGGAGGSGQIVVEEFYQ